MAEFQAWKPSKDKFFGPPDPTIERLRKPWPKDSSYELVETSYFGFNIPEENINCEIYHWFHPVFGVASGGIMIFKGIKSSQFNPDYLEYRNYMPLPDDIMDCRYENGVRVKMIEPLSEFEITFDDDKSDTHIELRTKAIMPAGFRPTGGHITQAMKTEGTLVLRGKRYQIDGYFSRDRSWGDPRSEKTLEIPPIGWHVGVFGEDLAFHVTAFDSPEINPALAKRYPGLENGKNYIWGYVWKNGKLLGIKSCQKSTRRAAHGVAPSEIDLVIVDENNETYEINGSIQALYPFTAWPAMPMHFCLTRWTYQGRTGYGDTQEGLYRDYLYENFKD